MERPSTSSKVARSRLSGAGFTDGSLRKNLSDYRETREEYEKVPRVTQKSKILTLRSYVEDNTTKELGQRLKMNRSKLLILLAIAPAASTAEILSPLSQHRRSYRLHSQQSLRRRLCLLVLRLQALPLLVVEPLCGLRQ